MVGGAITFIYGVNTVCTAVWDLYMDYEDTDDKIGAFNFLRDNIFRDGFNLLGQLVGYSGSRVEKIGEVLYYGSEIFLGGKGMKQLAGNLGNISIYSKFNPKKIKLWKMGKYSSTMEMATRQLDYTRYGYDVYQMTSGVKNMNDYTIGLYEAVE